MPTPSPRRGRGLPLPNRPLRVLREGLQGDALFAQRAVVGDGFRRDAARLGTRALGRAWCAAHGTTTARAFTSPRFSRASASSAWVSGKVS
jgi:hypothetical protein